MADRTQTSPPDARAAAGDGALPPGERIGRYVLLEALGRGGMSTVYRAEDPSLRRQVALKLLLPERTRSIAACERFVREGHVMAQLAHRHVATVYELGRHGAHLYLALELLEGGTLRAWLATPRSWRDASRMMRDVARGLAAAHARGIVHRDFKPDNVLLATDGTPRVCDFGLAGIRDGEARTLTAPGAVLGTPAYMAPEQRAGRPADARTDQYALCLVWLEALGRDPSLPADALGAVRAPRRLARILLRGLAADPDARWSSLDALLAAIDRSNARRRLAIGLGAAAAAAALAAIVWPRSPRAAAAPVRAADVEVRRHKLGDGAWRMTMAPDGHTIAWTSGERDALFVEDLDRRDRGPVPVPLPPGARVKARADALPAMSDGGRVVLVRTDDGALWRTGVDLPAAIRIRADAGGAVCLHPSGDRVAVARLHEPIELRATDDGRLLATLPAVTARLGHLCAWAGDRLVLGWRGPTDAEGRVHVLEPDGRVRLVLALPGQLGAIAAEPDRVIASHFVPSGSAPDGGERYTGAIVAAALDRDPAPRTLRTTPGAGFPQLVATARGLFVAREPLSVGLWVGALDGAAPVELHGAGTGAAIDGPAVWLDGETLAHSSGGAIVRRRLGDPRAHLLADLRGEVIGRVGDALLVRSRDGADEPRCTIAAVTIATRRTIADLPCATLARVECGGARCAIGRITGDEIAFASLDPATGAIGPTVATRRRGEVPMLALASDGRWALTRGGGAVELIDPDRGPARTLPVDGPIEEIAWGHDDRYLIATGLRGAAHALLRIGLEGRTDVLARSGQARFSSIRVSPDGRRVAVRTQVRLFEHVLIDAR